MNFKFISFPDPSKSNKNGLVAVGGNLSEDMIISAYIQGLFPWFSQNDPIMWWSPDPRMILYPDQLKISASLKQTLKNKKYNITFDNDFRAVIKHCSLVKRKGQDGTWITPEMIEAYCKIHEIGIAHSVEVYNNYELIGGLYGLAIGKVFFGESMFYLQSNASKVALFNLCKRLIKHNYHFIDVQQSTNHLKSLGAIDIPRTQFLTLLKQSVNKPAIYERWY